VDTQPGSRYKDLVDSRMHKDLSSEKTCRKNEDVRSEWKCRMHVDIRNEWI